MKEVQQTNVSIAHVIASVSATVMLVAFQFLPWYELPPGSMTGSSSLVETTISTVMLVLMAAIAALVLSVIGYAAIKTRNITSIAIAVCGVVALAYYAYIWQIASEYAQNGMDIFGQAAETAQSINTLAGFGFWIALFGSLGLVIQIFFQLAGVERWFIGILMLVVFCVWVIIPKSTDLIMDFDSDDEPDFMIHGMQPLGLDLIGGLRVLLEADIPTSEFTPDDLNQTAFNVGRRVNGLGLTEATVQVQGDNRVLVELPGVTDRQQAIDTIQQTALLEFVDFTGLGSWYQSQVDEGQDLFIVTEKQFELQNLTNEERETRQGHPVTGQPFHTDPPLTGEILSAASARLNETGRWEIVFEIEPEFRSDFADLTEHLLQQPMALVLDGQVLSAPTVQSRLSDGGVITGQFTQEEAQTLALQLRSGALPIPLSVESAVEVGATLGQESVALSVKAGIIGVFVVLAFMLIYYRLPGVAADLALGVFILLNLALFKLLPVTLTLPAITGFLISIGTAVDGNILIFERIKEELRAGKDLREAIQTGFDRAWASIRDSNLSTIIICSILFFFGQTPGASIVSGFAVTLALGLVLNLFTAIIVTRTFIFLIVGFGHSAIDKRRWLFGV